MLAVQAFRSLASLNTEQGKKEGMEGSGVLLGIGPVIDLGLYSRLYL